MQVSVSVDIDKNKTKVWQAITDIEHSAGRISGIDDIEVLDRPDDGLVGLKWRETRTMMGKEATEVMWITKAQQDDHYEVAANSNGTAYLSRLLLTPSGEGTQLTMTFTGKPQTVLAKLMSAILMPFFKGSIVKMLQQDLNDIKAYVEAHSRDL